MKKTFAVLLAALLLLSLFACGKKQNEHTEMAIDVSVLQEVFDLDEDASTTYGLDSCVCRFRYEGRPMRAFATMTQEIYDEIDALDFFEDEYWEKCRALLGTLKVTAVEDFSKYLPKQEELDAFKGKTGKDLLDAGYEYNGYGEGGDGIYHVDLIKGYFEYEAECTGPSDFDPEAEDFESAILPKLTVNALTTGGRLNYYMDGRND